MSQSLEPFPLDGLKLWHLLQSQITGGGGGDALKFDGRSTIDGSELFMPKNMHGGHNIPEINLYNDKMLTNQHHQMNHELKLPCNCPMCPIPDKKMNMMKPLGPLDSSHLNSHSHQNILHQPNQHHHSVLKQPSIQSHQSSISITINCSVCHKKIRNSKKQQQAAQNPNHYPMCDKCSRSQKNLYNHNNMHGHPNNSQNPHNSQLPAYSHNSHDFGQFSSHTVNDSHLSAHPCKVCKRGFIFKHDLDRHTKASRGECGKQFKCDKCNKYFSNGGNLKRHLMIHTGEKPYSCMVCNKSFRTKTLLENHIRTHTGEKPFPCHQCEKRFGKSENLKRHVKIHVK